MPVKTRSQTTCQKSIYWRWQTDNAQTLNHVKANSSLQKHPKGWSLTNHWGQCGQSCPCCRANLYKQNIDPDAKWGACDICIKN